MNVFKSNHSSFHISPCIILNLLFDSEIITELKKNALQMYTFFFFYKNKYKMIVHTSVHSSLYIIYIFFGSVINIINIY